MTEAATVIRKFWLGAKMRKRHAAKLADFRSRVPHIITAQRHARGFMVRLRMWRQALRAEEELWAAMEIQRTWRGYLGRVRWEMVYEQVWARETAAARMQAHVRGWLARTKVRRMRRMIARAEFEHARLRFKSAQRLQALARGVSTRKATTRLFARKTQAATQIQRICRGVATRRRLWAQVVQLRATIIQAAARGFLLRTRRFRLIAKAICIQRTWRSARRRPPEVKEKAFAEMRRRKENAAIIQKAFRSRKEGKEVDRIQQCGAAAPAVPGPAA